MKIKKTIITSVLVLVWVSNQLWAQETNPNINKDGLYFGVYTGTWFGTGKNSVMGSPLMGGLLMELKSGKGALAVNFDLVGNLTKTKTLYLESNNKLLERNKYIGAQISLQYSHELYSQNRFALEAVGGFGYGDLTFVPDDEESIGTKSLFIDPGVGARYFIGQKTFLQLKIQYNLANYKINDNVSTNISGNFVTTKLILGWK